jgi:3-methyladenine DNA glycosylase AlkD
MKNVLTKIRQELRKHADAKTRQSGERFFKEKIKLHGVKSALVGRIGKKYWAEVKDKSKEEIFALCEKLWQAEYLEETSIACQWSYFLRKDYTAKDFAVFEKWIEKYVSNWAACDTFCNHTMGAFVEMFPQFLENLKSWTRAKNRWMRRAAAVSLIVPAKRGKFLPDVLMIADSLLLDKEDMVQKGYGWLLKVASQAHQKEIFQYVMKNKNQMPRTALRYAIEKMPRALKERAMKK